MIIIFFNETFNIMETTSNATTLLIQAYYSSCLSVVFFGKKIKRRFEILFYILAINKKNKIKDEGILIYMFLHNTIHGNNVFKKKIKIF